MLAYGDRCGADEASSREMQPDGEIKATIKVNNTGDCNGEEVVQLYIRDLVACVTRPLKQLRGFEKIRLHPGENRKVEFVLKADDLAFLGPDLEKMIEPGEFDVMVGGSSDNVSVQRFTLRGEARKL